VDSVNFNDFYQFYTLLQKQVSVLAFSVKEWFISTTNFHCFGELCKIFSFIPRLRRLETVISPTQ